MSPDYYWFKLKFALECWATITAIFCISWLIDIPNTKMSRFFEGLLMAVIVGSWHIYWWWQDEKRQMRERAELRKTGRS
jgi:hypothetical protein